MFCNTTAIYKKQLGLNIVEMKGMFYEYDKMSVAT